MVVVVICLGKKVSWRGTTGRNPDQRKDTKEREGRMMSIAWGYGLQLALRHERPYWEICDAVLYRSRRRLELDQYCV
jgi:hypothetical protein